MTLLTDREAQHEEWRPIAGYETYYSVSSQGRVRREAPGPGTYVGRIVGVMRNGYWSASLSRPGPNGKIERHVGVHVLVAEAFVGPQPEGMEVNHKDGDKTHNTPDNVEWLTPSQNNLHAFRIGLKPLGEKHHKAILNTEAVRYIRASSESYNRLAAIYGVSKATVRDVKKGRYWRHVA